MLEQITSRLRMYGACVRLWQVEEEGEEFSLVLPEIEDIRSFILSLMGSLTKDFLVEEKTAVAVARAIPPYFQDSFIKKENHWLEVDKGANIVPNDYLLGSGVDDTSMICFDEIENDATMEAASTDDKILVFSSQNVIEGHDDDIETSDVDYIEQDAQKIGEEIQGSNENAHNAKAHDMSQTRFHCSECTKVFSSSFYLKEHLKSHEGFWPYPCTICDAKFKQVKYLKKHKCENHKDLFCPTCKVYHRNLRELKEHHCSKPYECPNCHRRFGTVCELKAHSLIHSGEKPHMCDLCGKGFRQRATLDRHKLTHQSKKNYSCEICGKNFKFKHYLVSHKRLHTGEKPHMCTWCGQSFSQSANMQKHIRQQHTMEKTHVCKHCGKGFVQPYYLKRHLITHREGKNKTDSSPEKEEKGMSDDCIGVRTVPCRLCSATTKTEKQLKIHMEMHHNLKLHTVSAEKQTSTRQTEEEQENLSRNAVNTKFDSLNPSAGAAGAGAARLPKQTSPAVARPALLVDHSSNLQQTSNHLQTSKPTHIFPSNHLQTSKPAHIFPSNQLHSSKAAHIQPSNQLPTSKASHMLPSNQVQLSKASHILPPSHVHSSNIHLKLIAARKITELNSQQIRYEH